MKIKIKMILKYTYNQMLKLFFTRIYQTKDTAAPIRFKTLFFQKYSESITLLIGLLISHLLSIIQETLKLALEQHLVYHQGVIFKEQEKSR